MLNVGTGELLVIFLLALLVLGPDKLPSAARQAGKVLAELRRMNTGFQDEMRRAMRDPTPTLPPLPPEAERHTPPAAPVVDAVGAEHPPSPDPPTRRRREPLRAGDAAVPAEQQLAE